MLFVKKYLTDLEYRLLLNNYEMSYLELLEEDRFDTIYNLLIEYKFWFIKDIIIKYIEVFTYPKEVIEKRIINAFFS